MPENLSPEKSAITMDIEKIEKKYFSKEKEMEKKTKKPKG